MSAPRPHNGRIYRRVWAACRPDLLTFDDPQLDAAHFNWLVMSIPLNRAMLLGDDSEPSAKDLNLYADAGVQTFPIRPRREPFQQRLDV